MTWNHVQDPMFPWVLTLDRIFASESPRTMDGPSIFIASDYGGTDKRSRYRVNAYLYVDLGASRDWEYARRCVRKRFLADGRRMSYKALSDRQRAAALGPFLAAAEDLHGFCVVTIVNKALRHLCFRRSDDYSRLRQIAGLEAEWKDRELEEACRATQVVACLVGGLARPNQNIFWISDEDNMFSNLQQSRDVGRILSSFIGHYVEHPLGELCMATTKLDEGDRFEEDLTAIADLVAGAVSEATNQLAVACGGRVPHNLAVPFEPELVSKAQIINDWFWALNGTLRRVAVVFESQPHGMYSVSKHEMIYDHSHIIRIVP